MKATINLTPEAIEAIEYLGATLSIKKGGGRPGKGDLATNRSLIIQQAVIKWADELEQAADDAKAAELTQE